MKGAPGLRLHVGADPVLAVLLARLLIRVAENSTGDTWRNVRHELGCATQT